jgi:hypothetical protein
LCCSLVGVAACVASQVADSSVITPTLPDDLCGDFCLPQNQNIFSSFILARSKRRCHMRLPSMKVMAAASAGAAAAAFLLLRMMRLRARRSCAAATSEKFIDSQQHNPPMFACDAAAAEERMRRGAISRGEPCVLDVCAANAAEYRRGGCDMIVRDFIEAGASEWAANALRSILVARGADQAFRFCARLLVVLFL